MDFNPASLSAMVRQAHRMVLAHQQSSQAESRMHSTLVALWLDSGAQRALWSHVGDSRLYRFRNRRNDVVTTDDSVVQRMVQSGLISAEQARHHPQKNQLVAALGVEGDIDPHTVARTVEVLDGDAYLLCSDGWWDSLEHRAVLDSLARALSPAQWLADMHQQIQSRAVPRQDNFSAVAVWVGDPGEVDFPGADDTLPRAVYPR
jgi:serine/threonine protein phosphatase PrpC